MTKSTKFICISGQARHGKDTAADILCEELTEMGYNVKIMHYADLLKYMCRTFFDWNGEKDVAGRQLLQTVGTDIIRKRNENYWVDFLIGIVNLFPFSWDYVIIPDTRFPNEIERIKEAGYQVTHLQIFRPNFDNGLTESQKQHASENALKDTIPDDVIANTSLNNLRLKLLAFITALCIKNEAQDAMQEIQDRLEGKT